MQSSCILKVFAGNYNICLLIPRVKLCIPLSCEKLIVADYFAFVVHSSTLYDGSSCCLLTVFCVFYHSLFWICVNECIISFNYIHFTLKFL